MQGTIKWFSQDKGYGYIVDEDEQDYYFNVRDIKGALLPHSGDLVSFAPGQGNKGLRATSVKITARGPSELKSDDRASCTGCGKRMVPRIITSRGSLVRSVCPFCGKTYKRFDWFILVLAGVLLFLFLVSHMN